VFALLVRLSLSTTAVVTMFASPSLLLLRLPLLLTTTWALPLVRLLPTRTPPPLTPLPAAIVTVAVVTGGAGGAGGGSGGGDSEDADDEDEVVEI
jgi:hypothetical protein